MAEPFIPPAVEREMQRLVTATHAAGTVERLSPRSWRITISNKRVVMTMDLKGTSSGRYPWHASTLKVDGVPQELARDYDELGRIFRNPGQKKEPVVLDPMPPTTKLEDAPYVVRKYYDDLRRQMGSSGKLEILLGKTNDRWVIGLRSDRATVRFNFARRGGTWNLAPRQPIQMVVDGVDYTQKVGNGIASALQLLSKQLSGNPPAADSSIGSPAGPAGTSNSVAVRRSSVKRE